MCSTRADARTRMATPDAGPRCHLQGTREHNRVHAPLRLHPRRSVARLLARMDPARGPLALPPLNRTLRTVNIASHPFNSGTQPQPFEAASAMMDIDVHGWKQSDSHPSCLHLGRNAVEKDLSVLDQESGRARCRRRRRAGRPTISSVVQLVRRPSTWAAGPLP
jgi:hypothetical protein